MDKRFYTQKKAGGLSPCILGNNSSGQRAWEGSVLPNCVGYAWGRFHEVCGLMDFPFWRRGDARQIGTECVVQGIPIGWQPVPHGLMIWDDRDAGHVAFVEEVRPDGTVVTSESGWLFTGEPVRHYVRSGQDWRTGCDWMTDKYKYIGCIHHPCFPDIRPQAFKDMQTGEVKSCLGFYADGRNYFQLAQLGDLGYIRVGYNVIDKLPEIGVKLR